MRGNTSSYIDKELYDVILVENEDLKINVDKNKKARPALIININDDGSGQVLIFTTKKNSNIKQLKINRDSYLNIDKVYSLSERQIHYSEIGNISVTPETIEIIESAFKLNKN